MSIGTTSVEDYDGVQITIEPFDPNLDINPVVTPIETEEEVQPELFTDWERFRLMRNNKLVACDWTQMADSPLSDSEKASWVTYRQQLRDLPSVITDPVPLINDRNHSSWPTPPFEIWYH